MKPRPVKSTDRHDYPSYDDYRHNRRTFLKRIAGTTLAAAAAVAAGVSPLAAQQVDGDIKVVQPPGEPPAARPQPKPVKNTGPAKPVKPLTEKQVKQAETWIGRLGDEQFKVREAASKHLVELGPAVVPVLKEHVEAKDPEVRRRVKDLIEHFEKQAPTDDKPVPPRLPGSPPAIRGRPRQPKPR
ncbi:MAG: twin-arginine translocation signal domain-containing protein [Planctomycetota bacterium]